MTTLPLVIGLVCLAGAIVLGVYLVSARPAQSEVSAQSVPIEVPAYAAPQRFATPGDQELPPLMQRLRSLATRLSPRTYGDKLQHWLDLAGNPSAWPAERVLAFKGIGLVGGVVLGGLLGLGHGPMLVVYATLFGVVGFMLPDIVLRRADDRRQAELQKGLPDALDMMVVCVEAGLGFEAALSRVALNLQGPIAGECARVLQEMQFGKSRTQALRALADRTDVADIRVFVSAIIQSAELGISVGDVLRQQAKEMRVSRRQRAEESAQKLPVKIVIPLILCLLPAMFVVVLGPGFINIVHALTNLGR